MASRRFDWRFLPLLLVLLTCNAETRQVVTQTIHYIVSGVCQELHCAAQTTQSQSLETLNLIFPTQSQPSLMPESLEPGVALTLLTLLLFWVLTLLWHGAGWVDSRAPPQALKRGEAWVTP